MSEMTLFLFKLINTFNASVIFVLYNDHSNQYNGEANLFQYSMLRKICNARSFFHLTKSKDHYQ